MSTEPLNLNTTTLRPGLLVSLKTGIVGNVKYDKTEIDAENIDTNGVLKAKWQTDKTIENAAEYEAASKVRGKARSLIAGVCSVSAFGYLCPETAKENLDRSIIAARKLVEDFNATAEVTRVYLYTITGRVAADDVEAVKAINAEVRGLLDSMSTGLKTLDVTAVRKAASEARQLGQMLTKDAQARIQIAIDAARDAATKIKAAGEQAAGVLDAQAINVLNEARTAFLDLDEPTRAIGSSFVAGRAVDLTSDETPAAPVSAVARQAEV